MDQPCAEGLEASIEGGIHAMQNLWELHQQEEDQVLELQSELADDHALCGSDVRCCVFDELFRGLLRMKSECGHGQNKHTNDGRPAPSSHWGHRMLILCAGTRLPLTHRCIARTMAMLSRALTHSHTCE
jgi:hypothetical protein